MPSKPFPPDALQQAREVLQAWKNIDPAFKVGDLALSALEADIAQLTSTQDELTSLESQATEVRSKRDDVSMAVWDKVKRLRRGVQAIYGDDSAQYQMMGGTRLSERKPPTRKAKAASPTS